MKFWTPSLWGILTLCVLEGGCALGGRDLVPKDEGPSSAAPTETSVSASSMAMENENALAHLWEQRTHESLPPDLSLGVGDVLEISVLPGEVLKDFAVRIGGDGLISLPLIGKVRASGQSEAALEEEIRQRYAETYIRNPHVHVFVREYRSRLAAVVGAVDKPGVYSMTKGNDTILEMLSQAGGVTKESASRLLFFPVEMNNANKPIEVASTTTTAVVPTSNGGETPSRSDPLVINLKGTKNSSSERYLALPVRPGDVIMAPAAGEVLVDGWVDKPGAYQVTPGLTVLGAVAAAGGLNFAADSSKVKVTRMGNQGGRFTILSDLEKIKQGNEPDIPVQEGDVIEVAFSKKMAVPYGVYSFFTNVFRIYGSTPLY